MREAPVRTSKKKKPTYEERRARGEKTGNPRRRRRSRTAKVVRHVCRDRLGAFSKDWQVPESTEAPAETTGRPGKPSRRPGK